jgi:phospholipase A1
MNALDIYDRATATGLGLHATNLKVAKDTHAILARNKKPTHVKYVYLAGTSEDTWIRVNTSVGAPRPVAGKDAGDGTVPLWSAVEPTRLHHVAPGVHAEIFRHEQIRAVMYRAVGARMPGVSFVSAAGKPLIMLQTGELVYASGASVDVMLIPSNAFAEINGELVVEFSNDPMSAPFAPFQRTPLIYKGPEVDQIKVRLQRLNRNGFYRVSFEGTHEVDAGGQAIFAISPVGGATGAKQ